jgi:hypothetical protein
MTNRSIEQEINEIRLKIYEKTKDMTPSQLTDYYKQSTEATIKKYGFKVIANANVTSATKRATDYEKAKMKGNETEQQ